ncbi:MAG: hypothetical protein KAS32_10410 [Candidatus Peribacteraceae bacterium]|nr:hypothetical protein [Candidatus Peribacteraceae bacterium]
MPKVEKEWTCSSGLSDVGECFQRDCMSEKQLIMWDNRPDYKLTFNAPMSGEYKCTITAITNYFDYSDIPQINEVTDVYLNEKKVGSTVDKWCPQGDDDNDDDPVVGDICEAQYFKDFAGCNYRSDVCTWETYKWYDKSSGRCMALAAKSLCGPNHPGIPVSQEPDKSCYGCLIHWRFGDCDYNTPTDCSCDLRNEFACNDIPEKNRCLGGGRNIIVTSGVNCQWECPEGTLEDHVYPYGSPYEGHSVYEHYTNLHDEKYICCYAKDNSVPIGGRCVRDSECTGSVNCVDTTTDGACSDNSKACACGDSTPTCSDGVRNYHDGAWETEVDCGGPCELCDSGFTCVGNEVECNGQCCDPIETCCGGACCPNYNECINNECVFMP